MSAFFKLRQVQHDGSVEQRLGLEHGQQAVADGPQGAGMTMTALAQNGVFGASSFCGRARRGGTCRSDMGRIRRPTIASIAGARPGFGIG